MNPRDLWGAWRERSRRKKEARRKKGPKDHWLREAMETLATAVIMAIIVRHFAIEAFAIPTESMAPTLYGNVYGAGAGDRILVNKYPLYWRGPERWSIVVFRYPLDTSQNYVKRLVGLGGETLELRDGDAWVDGRIERKPTDVQEKVWRNVYPAGLSKTRRRSAWTADDVGKWRMTGDGFEVGAEGTRRLVYEPAEVKVLPSGRFVRAAVSDYFQGAPNVRPQEATSAVGDLRLRLTCRIDSGGGAVVLRLIEWGRKYELTLPASGAPTVSVDGEVRRIEEVSLERGEEIEVAFANVDDAVEVHVDGDLVFRREYETDGAPPLGRIANAVEIDVRDAGAKLTEIRLDRDIHYCQPSPHWITRIKIPEGHYVMLGDNSNNSYDGRAWGENVFALRDGTVHRAGNRRTDPETNQPVPALVVTDEVVRFVDVQGIPREIPLEDLAAPPRGDAEGLPAGNARSIRMADGRVFTSLTRDIRPVDGGLRFVEVGGGERSVKDEDLAVPFVFGLDHAPFVTRDKILGEAFFVFWPAWPPARFRLRFL